MSFRPIDWNFPLLDSLIQGRGDNVLVETGIACPCRNGDTYAALVEREGKPASQRLMSCPQCKGDGFIYRNARCVRGLVTSLNPVRDRRLLDAGFALPGDVRFSPELNAALITDLDKVTLPVPVDVNEGQVIMRGAAGMEDNAIFVTDLAEDEDRLWYEAVCSVWCEDINGVVYSQKSDFEFENHKIRWVGNSPDVGTLYTVKYTAYVEWVVYMGGMERFDNARSLGQMVMLRKKHVAFLSDKADNSASTRASEEVSFTTRTKV